MKKRFVLSGLGLSIFVLACSGGGTTTPDGGAPDSGNPDVGKTSLLGFTPSNFDVTTLDFSGVTDFTVSIGKTWETDLGGVLGGDGTYNYKEVAQSNGLKLGIFTVKSLTIAAGVTVNVEGADALVIVALDKIDIQGSLIASSTHLPTYRLGPGALDNGSLSNVVGLGAGGGGAGSGATSGGGAGFCGTGGAGAALTGQAAEGGPSYGNASLIPLVAGSSGGVAFSTFGNGGGAVQLVAANSISVSGVVHVGGSGSSGGGTYDPPMMTEEASGGGSGGAILFESASITMSGTLASNGGGGGQGEGAAGGDSTPDSMPAQGGNDGTHGSAGGAAAAGTMINGSAGAVSPASTSGGGGGAAGRIRMNTLTGAATITGTISPATSTACTTQGVVAP